MSEFFRALEQAERDRVRQDQPSAPGAPGPRPARSENLAPKPSAPEPEPSPAVAGSPAPEAVAPAPAMSRPPTAAPAPPTVAPIQSTVAASPASVFRRSLKTPHRSRVASRAATRGALLVTQTDPSSVEADAYRTLRANIELTSDNGAYRYVAITSPGGGDGKSTTAANLAIVAAQGGRRVCLVDADVRRPMLHEVFGLPNVDGLGLALEQGRPLESVAKASDIDNLSIVVAGRGAHETFHDLLTSSRLETILRGSETVFDLVLFDSPPIIVSDALNVAAVCDGVILVVRAGSVPFGVLQRAIGQVKQVKGRVLGVLLNRADPRATDAGAYRYYRGYTRSKS